MFQLLTKSQRQTIRLNTNKNDIGWKNHKNRTVNLVRHQREGTLGFYKKKG